MTTLPPLTLLDPAPADPGTYDQPDHGRTLRNTASAHGVTMTLAGEQIGASVVRYLFDMPDGGDPRKVERLIEPFSLACKVQVRYAGTLAGLVALEVPREQRDVVMLSDVYETQDTPRGMLGYLDIGEDVAGSSVGITLAQLPHLLVAGATGQGKSVFINATLVSLLLRNTPDELELVLIDPKRVELSPYAGLPHLAQPIITDMGDAAAALATEVALMESRYKRMQNVSVKNIEGWNGVAGNAGLVPWPRRLIVIDELADLMATHGKAVEEHISRLGALGRAAGVHLIVATQRPSADIITGRIRTNLPSRIAFTTASAVESRVIGIPGAERLTGAGDALWSPIGQLAPTRVQTPYVSEGDVARVVAWWIENWVDITPILNYPTPAEELKSATANPAFEVADLAPLIEKAREAFDPSRWERVASEPLLDVADPMDLLVLELVEEMKAARPIDERPPHVVIAGGLDVEVFHRLERLEKAVTLLAEMVARDGRAGEN